MRSNSTSSVALDLERETPGGRPARSARTRPGTSRGTGVRRIGSGCTRSRRFSSSTSFTIRSSRPALSRMMRDQALARRLPVLLVHQLGRVGDRGERVADLVRDVGGEPAERGELQLARLVLELGDVLEVDHGKAVVSRRRRRRTARARGCRSPGSVSIGVARPVPAAPVGERLRELDRERLDLVEFRRRRARAAGRPAGLWLRTRPFESTTSTPSCTSWITRWLMRSWLARSMPRCRATRSLVITRCASRFVTSAVAK